MKHFFTLLAMTPLAVFGQTTWEVEAGGSTAPGSTTDPYYEPMELEIMVGDIVHWDAVSGSHNVYGELDDFPDNPEGFSSGEPDNDLDWSYTFTIPGVYGYHCTQQGHSATQHGTITVVEDDTNVEEEETSLGSLSLYPSPASGQLNISLDGGDLRAADIFSVDGRLQMNKGLIAGQRNIIDVSALTSGRYMLRLVDTNGHSIVRPFVKD